MNLVLDASVALAWIYPDETTDAVRAVFDSVANDGAVVPAAWRLEVANGLTVALRRHRISAGFRAAALSDSVDADTDVHAWANTLQFADRFRLTVYDAAYLELAQRRLLPLASLDNELRAAARALGVGLLGTAA